MRDYNRERFIHELEKSFEKLRCGDWEEIEKYMYQYHLLHIKSLRLPEKTEAEACKAVALAAMQFYIGSAEGTRFLLNNMGCRKLAIWLSARRANKNLTLASLSEELDADDVDRLMNRFTELNFKAPDPSPDPNAEAEGGQEKPVDPTGASGAESGGGKSTAP